MPEQKMPLAAFDEQAEKALLGATIMDHTTFEIVRSRVLDRDFFYLKHTMIWQAMERIRLRQRKVDFSTVQSELERSNNLDEIGGLPYLTELIAHYNQVDHVDGYVDSIVEMALRRQMMAGTARLVQEAQNLGNDLPELMSKLDALSIALHQRSSGDMPTLAQLIAKQFDQVTERMQHPEALVGIPTGFSDLDKLIQGFIAGQLVVLAGRPGMGKTAWMLAVIRWLLKSGKQVGLFSLEMSAEMLIHRLIAMETGIPAQRLRTGKISEPEYERLIQAQSVFYKFKDQIFINDKLAMGVSDIKAETLKWQMEHGIDFIAIDYLQLMIDKDAGRQSTREREVANITRGLKGLAKDLAIPVMALAQLNRGVELRQDKRPLLSDLRESGSIEQDADIVMFLYREAYYNSDSETPNGAELIVAKQRDGPIGTVPLYFDKQTATYKNGVRREVDFGAYNAGRI